MGIFLLEQNLQGMFAESPEIFAAVQFGRANNDRSLLVIGCQVAIEFELLGVREDGMSGRNEQ
jgi:hypothetical protein